MMRSALLRGLGASLSIAVGYVPVAISFGLAAVYADIPPYMAVLISVLVYAGAAQFVLISLVVGGGAAFSIVGVVLLMNLRHLFYGPAILSRLDGSTRKLPLVALAAGLTDEVFATSVGKLREQPAQERELWYAGLQLGAYASWVAGTAVGAWFGRDWLSNSAVLTQTLGFVLPALFLALLLEIRTLVRSSVLVGAALVSLLALTMLPGYAAILVGMGAGILMALRS
ncbi:AzlC family ABC transporter permease [Alcaligenaceae bacterium]|nr:AzlC family ABC transporter permease [Alcaligenaceae bacterium]